MKKIFCILLLSSGFYLAEAQPIGQKISRAYQSFVRDAQLQNALVSLYVIDESTGKEVFNTNGFVGMAPASTQKIITSAAAYEILGSKFSYKTAYGYSGEIKDSILNGSLIILPSGDPTLGSWRWQNTTETAVLSRILGAFRSAGIIQYHSILVNAAGWQGEVIPGGWMYEDIGNYYGAGADKLNWRENQFDLLLQSGNQVGDPVIIRATQPSLYGVSFRSFAKAAAKGTGDNAYLYYPLSNSSGTLRGTIPVGENSFTISGAMPSGRNQFISTLLDSLGESDVHAVLSSLDIDSAGVAKLTVGPFTLLGKEESPILDSITYYFLKRSVNLYGEAFAKTIAAEKAQEATTKNGVAEIKKYLTGKIPSVNETELNLHDGSGLSPLNRVTTHAQVAILQYAKKQSWFSGFYLALPEFNGMKMKSGTISGVKGFCGYQTSASGKKYIFSFLVNNYNGSAGGLVKKMYQVLDVLK